MSLIDRFLADERGATAIEYGLIAALVSIGIIGTLGSIGDSLVATFTTASNSLAGDG